LTQLVKCENLKPPQSVNFAKDGLAHYKDKRQKRQKTKDKRQDKARTRQDGQAKELRCYTKVKTKTKDTARGGGRSNDNARQDKGEGGVHFEVKDLTVLVPFHTSNGILEQIFPLLRPLLFKKEA
jgi:hypothetical protein